MGTTATQNNALYGPATIIAGVARAPEDSYCILHIPHAAVGFNVQFDAGPFPFNSQAQHFSDGRMEGLDIDFGSGCWLGESGAISHRTTLRRHKCCRHRQ